jgi:hypothetical protein
MYRIPVAGVILALVTLLDTHAVMAQTKQSLHVQSVANQRTAAPNNSREASVYVVVQSVNGLVSGLTLKNFAVKAQQVAPGGAVIKVVRVISGAKGVYRIDIVPGVKGATWLKGDYVISTNVTSGSMEGASVAVMPVN